MKNPILVTGASSRVGFAIAEALFEEGYPIVAVYRSGMGQLEALPGVHAIQADLATEAGRAYVVEQVQQRYEALRGVVHNASAWLGDEPGALEAMHAIHVAAPYYLNMALGPLLKRSEFKADIIHVTDDTALRGSARHVAYVSTKAAMANLTLSFAKLFAPDVAVNSVAPGFLLAPEGSAPDFAEQAKQKALIQTEPGAAPVVEAIRYLLASRYVTGTTMVVRGGRHLK